MTPREAADHAEIARVLQLYFRAMDEKDYGLLERVFTRDAALHYDMQGGSRTTLAGMLPLFEDFNRAFAVMQHLSGLPFIEVDGDEGRSVLSLRALHVQRTREGKSHPWTVYGFYRDRLVRTPEGWRIADRHFAATHFEGRLLPRERLLLFDRPPWQGGQGDPGSPAEGGAPSGSGASGPS